MLEEDRIFKINIENEMKTAYIEPFPTFEMA